MEKNNNINPDSMIPMYKQIVNLLNAKIEKGEVDLQNSKILLFANALGTTPGKLMGLTDYDSKEPTTLAAHFEGEEYTEDELAEIRQFAEFVRNKRK